MNDIFILPTYDENNYIIYAPLSGVSFWANNRTANIIRDYIDKGIEIPSKYVALSKRLEDINKVKIKMPGGVKAKHKMNKATFILSQKCNLACSYCYAEATRSQNTIDKKRIAISVDYILKNSSNKTVGFSFIGGGEPTIDWDLFCWAVNYIKSNSKNQKINLGLVTNATLLNKTRVSWLKGNDVRVSVSFDILPEVQNMQRPFSGNPHNSFDIVDRNLKLLMGNALTTRIRSTITEYSVTLMPKMVQFVVDNYPQIKRLQFEPVSGSVQNMKCFYDKYIDYFFISRDIALRNNIDVYNSLTNATERIRTSFCSGELCITPKGEIVYCHRASSEEDEKFNCFVYGKVEDTVQIQEEKLEYINSISNANFERCFDCFAKWHCAGMCLQNRLMLSEEQLSIQCTFIRKMIKRTLEDRVNICQGRRKEDAS